MRRCLTDVRAAPGADIQSASQTGHSVGLRGVLCRPNADVIEARYRRLHRRFSLTLREHSARPDPVQLRHRRLRQHQIGRLQILGQVRHRRGAGDQQEVRRPL